MTIRCITQKPAFQLQAMLDFSGHALSFSHAQQIIAAALGYKSLAALQACPQGADADAMAAAQAILLHKPTLSARLNKLKAPTEDFILERVREVLQDAWREQFGNPSLTVWWRLSAYLDHIEVHTYDPEEHFLGALADANAFVEGAWLSVESVPEPQAGPLGAEFDRFEIEVEMDLEPDPERALTTMMSDYLSEGFDGTVTALATRHGPRGITFQQIEPPLA